MDKAVDSVDALLPAGMWYWDVVEAARRFADSHLKLPVVDDPSHPGNMPGFPVREQRLNALTATLNLAICQTDEYQDLFDWDGPGQKLSRLQKVL